MEKKRIVLPTKKFFKANEQDNSLRINLSQSENLLREGDKDIILDIAEQFNTERNDSKNYKIYGKIRMVFRNIFSGQTSYVPLSRDLYLLGDGTGSNDGFLPYNEFAFLRNDVVREKNSPNSGSTLGTFSQNITVEGYTGHTTVTPIMAPYHNWNLYLSYVYTGDTSFPMRYTLTGNTYADFTAGDGIPFRVYTSGKYYKFISPVEHGISAGEYLILSGGSFNNSIPLSGRTYYVDSVGDETYNSSKYVLNILQTQIETGYTLSNIMVCKRCIDKNNINGTTSQYYVHKHKTLTTYDSYLLDKLGFESSIWEEEKKLLFENSLGTNDYLVVRNRMESLYYSFKQPFILTGITNNLGYTPTDVYVSVIFKNGNGYFNYPPKVGYKFHFHDTWIDQHFSGNTSEETSLTSTSFSSNTPIYSAFTFNSGNSLSVGSTLTGAFVEYNDRDFKERIISEAFHKLSTPNLIFDHDQDDPTTYSGASADNLVGLFYQPHNRVKLRELSPYVESYNTNDIFNLPENVKYDNNEKLWKWRDLYDHGYVDPDGYGTDFPFMNNNHYVHNDINFYLRNEQQYRNKADGIIKIKNRNIDC
jgi:hypothetical protein